MEQGRSRAGPRAGPGRAEQGRAGAGQKQEQGRNLAGAVQLKNCGCEIKLKFGFQGLSKSHQICSKLGGRDNINV